MSITELGALDRPARAPARDESLISSVLADRMRGEADVMEEARSTKQVVSFREWSQRIPTARQTTLDFVRFPYQPEFYDVLGDLDIKEVDAMKGVQIGASEAMTRLGLYLPDVHNLTALYVFPALKQMYDFSDARVNPLRENSEYLRERTTVGPWNKGLKRVGRSLVYYRGSESKRDLIAVDADAVLMDEYDLLHPPNVPEAEKRISGSLIGLTRRVGIPTDPEYGIAKRYTQSDRRQWLVKCTRCDAGWQPIDFWKNVTWETDEDKVIHDPAVVCHQCRKPLDVLKGEWVAEKPGRSPGFHIHRLMVASERNLRMLIADSLERDPVRVKAFWTNDLGLPYADEAGGLSRKDIATALTAGEVFARTQLDQEFLLMTPGYRGTNVVTAGIDVASVRALNVRISEHIDPLTQAGHRKRALWVGTCDSFEEVTEKLQLYNVHYAVVDHLPEGRLARGLATQFWGRVYVAHYSQNQLNPLVVNSEDMTLGAQRVPALDATKAIMQQQRNLLPADIPADYVEQMVTPRRKIEKDEFDRQTVTWESKGPDDYFQAETYDVLATEVAKIRMEYDDFTREEQWQLDERLDFERSRVADNYDTSYRPGPGGDDDFEYKSGPSE